MKPLKKKHIARLLEAMDRAGMKVVVVKKGNRRATKWTGEQLRISRKAAKYLLAHEFGHWTVAKRLFVADRENYGLYQSVDNLRTPYDGDFTKQNIEVFAQAAERAALYAAGWKHDKSPWES